MDPKFIMTTSGSDFEMRAPEVTILSYLISPEGEALSDDIVSRNRRLMINEELGEQPRLPPSTLLSFHQVLPLSR